jgi:hypothetical protein
MSSVMNWRVLLLGVMVACTASACRRAGANVDVATDGAAVSLTRAACFGTCPVYTVTVFTDGRVVYDGEAHVSTTGRQEARVTADSVRALVRTLRAEAVLARDARYVDGEAGCGRFVTDGPRFTLVLHADGPRRTLEFDAGCTGAPRTVPALADAVDRVADTRRWITGGTEN